VLPLYYERSSGGPPTGWIAMAKRSIATILPRYRASRMLDDYVAKFYAPAARAGRRFGANGRALAHALARWKEHVTAAWSGVRARRIDSAPGAVMFGDEVMLRVAVALNGLSPDDLLVELVVVPSTVDGTAGISERAPFSRADTATMGTGEAEWALAFRPDRCGAIDYRIRVYPWHPELTHPFETGLMVWL
jgi:glycogen phosphorylase